MKHYVYIIECRDGSLYTGYTLNVEKRVYEHNFSKKGAKSIKGKLPASLVFLEEFSSKTVALKREYEIKGWSRIKKQTLIKSKTAPHSERTWR